MTKFLILIVMLLVAVVAFYGGMQWQREHIGDFRKWRLTEPMELQKSPEHLGELPAGTTLYEYRMLPETGIYIVFVTTQQRDALKEYEPTEGKQNEVDPLSGYVSRGSDSSE